MMQGGRPEVPAEDCLPPGTSSNTCKPVSTAQPEVCLRIACVMVACSASDTGRFQTQTISTLLKLVEFVNLTLAGVAQPPPFSLLPGLWSYIRLMQDCWSHEPSARPSFEAIARRIKAMQRWRKVISNLQPVDAAAVWRAHSMTAARGTVQSTGNAAGTQSSSSPPARRVASAPTATQQQRPLWQALLRPQSLHPFPSLWQQQGPFAQQQQQVQSHSHPWGAHTSTVGEVSSMCSAILHGERIAIIPTCPATDVVDCLASVAGPAQTAQARVLLVASDLPSHQVGQQQCSSVRKAVTLGSVG